MRRGVVATGLLVAGLSVSVGAAPSAGASRVVTPHRHAQVLHGRLGRPRFLALAPRTPVSHAAATALKTYSTTFSSGGASYKATIVGANPSTLKATQVGVQLYSIALTMWNYCGNSACTVPYVFHSNDITTATKASPVFALRDYSTLLGDTGKLQYTDAYMRQAFNKQNSAYHVTLAPGATIPTLNINAYTDYQAKVVQVDSDPTHWVVQMEEHYLYGILQTVLPELQTEPNQLVLFLTKNLVLYTDVNNPSTSCCVLGFHSADPVPGGVQTFAWASYLSPWAGFGVGLSDVAAISHEVAEWTMDPYINNRTPSWQFPTNPPHGCQSNLEVGDVTEALDASQSEIRLSGNKFFQDATTDGNWHMVNGANPSWFFGNLPSTSAGGRYDIGHILTAPATAPPSPC
jgi:hypothetical protein